MNKQFDLLIDSYLDNKVGIALRFLNADLAHGLLQNLLHLQKDDLMFAAGIGNEVIIDVTQKVRSDKIYWMDKNRHNLFEQEFLRQMEDFIERLNSICYAGINAYEFHYAIYEVGSFYKRHKDQFRNNSDRKYSLICYLNENWQEEDGGQLMLYKNDTVQKILPQFQSAVFFKSAEIEHEVTLTNRCRMSITGWLKRI